MLTISTLDIVLKPLFFSFIISLILVPFTIKLAKYLDLVDDPTKRKHPASIHTKPIPRAGGLPIYISILFCSIFFLTLNKIIFSIMFAGFIVVMLGLFDDKYDLSPYLRFIINILCASIVVFSGVDMPFVTNPFGGILYFNNLSFNLLGVNILMPFSSIFAILWVVWIMNMLNWSKGVDGQMPGIASISAVIIGFASIRFLVLEPMNIEAAKMSFIIAGASLGFLFFNFYPAKIHPGYSATILGFMIGVLSLLSSVKIATAVLVMGVPMVDALITIIRRIISKKSPFWHDKGHLHHLLLEMGLGQRKIAVFYWIMSLILGILSLSLSTKGKLFVIIFVIAMVIGFIITLKYLIKNGSSKSLDKKNIEISSSED